MRILILITRADEIGGAQMHVHDLAYYLRNRGYDVLVAYGMKGKFVADLEKKQIETIYVPYLVRNISVIKDILAIQQFRKILKKFNPDVVSCHSTKAGLVGRIATYFENKKVIFTAHGWAFTDGVGILAKISFSIIERFLARITTATINVSNYDKNIAIRNKIRCAHYVVHNCIADRSYKINKFDEDRVIISVVARFCAQKDHETFIRALGMLDKKLNYEVNFIGSGDTSEMKKLATECGVIDKVVFLGERKNVPELLDKTHIFCLPSNWEGFPISIIEAMRARCAIIASNVGGVNESTEHLNTGILVNKKDVKSWAYHLDYLISNKKYIEKYANAARQRFEKDFIVSTMIDKYETIIKRSATLKNE